MLKLSDLPKTMKSLRWAFNYGAWLPDSSEWTLAARCIQVEEKERIGHFRYKRDAKSSMAGRLLIRKAITDCLGLEYDKIKLGRTATGKPYLLHDNEPRRYGANQFSFNISHQGDYVVLAAESCGFTVGIDVMKTDQPRGTTLEKYFHTMRRQFTGDEWTFIRSHTSEREQLEAFYRLWCLKESYVKALGIGIGFALNRLSFRVRTPCKMAATPDSDVTITDTQLYVDGDLADEWCFEETGLDTEHTVAVALSPIPETERSSKRDQFTNCRFQKLSFSDLISSAKPFSGPDLQYWESFNSKEEKPPGPRATQPDEHSVPQTNVSS